MLHNLGANAKTHNKNDANKHYKNWGFRRPVVTASSCVTAFYENCLLVFSAWLWLNKTSSTPESTTTNRSLEDVQWERWMTQIVHKPCIQNGPRVRSKTVRESRTTLADRFWMHDWCAGKNMLSSPFYLHLRRTPNTGGKRLSVTLWNAISIRGGPFLNPRSFKKGPTLNPTAQM